MVKDNSEQMYFKIANGVLKNGKEYFGIFVSNTDQFECNHDTFVRGWEIEKLTPEIKVEFEAEIRKDARQYIEVV